MLIIITLIPCLKAVRSKTLWSKASVGMLSTLCQLASAASSAALTASWVEGTRAANATLMHHHRGSRPGSLNAPTCKGMVGYKGSRGGARAARLPGWTSVCHATCSVLLAVGRVL
jgi:hypothetical protein